ncbi:MAG: beta-propeller fold lactonase family protein [Polyangiaceae bacterium]
MHRPSRASSTWKTDPRVILAVCCSIAAVGSVAPGCGDDTTNPGGGGSGATGGNPDTGGTGGTGAGVIGGAGGNGTGGDVTNGGGGAGGSMMQTPVSQIPSRGSSIAASEDGTLLAVANKASNSITLFTVAADGTPTLKTKVAVGAEPVSAVFSPDNATLYVVNRLDQTVSVIGGANSMIPTVIDTYTVGSEPGHIALSPTGETAYVSNWADGTLSIIDTGSGATSTVTLGGAPMAVCVTNNKDMSETDETIYVTDFYGRPNGAQKEATDTARVARVFAVKADTHAVSEITLQPTTIDLPGVMVAGGNTGDPTLDLASNTSTYPNQLYSCVINGDNLYVTAVGASPAAFNHTTDFHQNIHGLVYAIDTTTNTVDDTQLANMSELVQALPAGGVAGEGRRFAAVPADIAFPRNSSFGYVAAMTGNMLLRLDYSGATPKAGAASTNFLGTDASPTGVAIIGTHAYTYNEVGRSITEIDLAAQTTVTLTIESEPLPVDDPQDPGDEFDVLRGQRFFNTGTGRWSTGAWCGCVGCHPFGTTDNVTWVFPAGPRQTVDTSTTWDKSGAHQRILNWSAIFDEVHDFELNTRNVAGGVGAVVNPNSNPPANSDRIDFVGLASAGFGVGNPQNAFNVGSVKGVNDVGSTGGFTNDAAAYGPGLLKDWDEINEYVRSIRSPRGRSASALVGNPSNGRTLFQTGNCQNCHSGPAWTISELYYTPKVNSVGAPGDLRLETLLANGTSSLGSVPVNVLPADNGGATIDVNDFLIGNDANGAPQRHICVSRRVGTFNLPGPDARGADEIRQNGAVAQGVGGFNVPSLLNMTTGAPYFHNGSVDTLEDLLSSAEFQSHLRAGNQIFAPSAAEVADLVAFLQTIDDDTPTFMIPAGMAFCPGGVTF